MKKLIISISLLIMMSSSFSMSIAQVKNLYLEMIHKNHLRGLSLNLTVSKEINAWTNKYRIIITTADLNLPDAELALLLGHELAHVQFHDPYHEWLGGTKEEDRADKYGSYYAYNLGYSYCSQSHFFIRLYKLYGNLGGSKDSHSSNIKRFWELYKYCK